MAHTTCNAASALHAWHVLSKVLYFLWILDVVKQYINFNDCSGFVNVYYSVLCFVASVTEILLYQRQRKVKRQLRLHHDRNFQRDEVATKEAAKRKAATKKAATKKAAKTEAAKKEEQELDVAQQIENGKKRACTQVRKKKRSFVERHFQNIPSKNPSFCGWILVGNKKKKEKKKSAKIKEAKQESISQNIPEAIPNNAAVQQCTTQVTTQVTTHVNQVTESLESCTVFV
jgi:hypothetical protein